MTGSATRHRSAIGAAPRLALGAALAIVAAVSAGCAASLPDCAPGSAGCTSILFLGNSYTYVNDLPSTFDQLAASGGHPLHTQMVANGGETLMQHAASTDSNDAIASLSWNFVVLQEQSETPATDYGRQEMATGAHALAVKAQGVGARTLLFMTPAHRDGSPDAGMPTYQSMQWAIDEGYVQVGRRLDLAIVPAGYAWFMLHQQHPEIVLWQDDGSHPTVAGTYLEACVFYDSIFHRASKGLAFADGLSRDEAQTVQSTADDNVLPNLSTYGLDF